MAVGLGEWYDGDFDQWMMESPYSKMSYFDDLGTYSVMFHEPFFDIEGPCTTASEEEIYRWLQWCIFYGKPKEEYPDKPKD